MPVDITAASLSNALRLTLSDEVTEEITRLLAVATTLVNQVAPHAPNHMANEAVVRFAGYLYDAPTAANGLAYANAWRNSGAASLLYFYKEVGIGADISALIPVTPGGGGGGGNVPSPPASGEFVLTAENGVLEWISFPQPS